MKQHSQFFILFVLSTHFFFKSPLSLPTYFSLHGSSSILVIVVEEGLFFACSGLFGIVLVPFMHLKPLMFLLVSQLPPQLVVRNSEMRTESRSPVSKAATFLDNLCSNNLYLLMNAGWSSSWVSSVLRQRFRSYGRLHYVTKCCKHCGKCLFSSEQCSNWHAV